MTIIDLIVNDLELESLSSIQLMQLASRIIDCAVEKLNGKEDLDYEEE